MFYIVCSIADQTKGTHKVFKIPTKEHLSLEFVWFVQPCCSSSSVLATAARWHAWISQELLSSTANSVLSFWQLESNGSKTHHLPSFHSSIVLDPEVGRLVISFKATHFLIIATVQQWEPLENCRVQSTSISY